MIATLKGTVSEKIAEQIVLDVNGVGYGLHVTAEDFSHLQISEQAKLYVYEHVREQAYELFGFASLDTKKLFEQLLGVKNVGPKVAMAVLDVGSPSEVRVAISGGNVKLLQSAKGVGKRAAEQIVVELRDKVGLAVSDSAEGIVTRGSIDAADEAAQALVALGFSDSDAMIALKDIDKTLPVEDRIKQALKGK